MRPVVLLSCGSGRGGQAQVASARGPADFGPPGQMGVKVQYVQGVERAGGAVLLLPNTCCREVVVAALAACHGLLLTGGGDVEPARYGQPAHPATDKVDTLRDATEILAVQEAMRRGLPVLGICRGIQLLNVALGGTLIQDIAECLRESALNHCGPDHPVCIQAGALLAELWPGPELVVNSRHHQAVDRLADGLRAVAWARDGIVEALEAGDGYPLLGLQCHPEDLLEREEFLAPFRWLVSRARRVGA